MYKLFFIFYFCINLNAIENLFFQENKLNPKTLNGFSINVKEKKLFISNKNNLNFWFLRIINLDKKEEVINNYLYNDVFEKEIEVGTYNVYIKNSKTGEELNINLNYNNYDLNNNENIVIDLYELENNVLMKNFLDISYGIEFTKNSSLNFFNYNKEPIFIRLSNFGNNILNGYYYNDFNQFIEDGVYTLYLKTKNSEIEKNIYIKGKKIINQLDIKSARMIRDIPYFNNKYLFQWYPIRLNNLDYKYLIQFKKGSKIESFITDKYFFEIGKLEYDHYRVLSFPSIIYSGKKVEDLNSIYKIDDNKHRWIEIKNTNNVNYLIGEDEPMVGNLSDLSLYLPSGFSFTDKKNEYIITSADRGEIIYVKDNKFKRHKYKNNIGKPLSLAYPNYIGNNKFIMIDNTTSRLVEFDINTANLKTVFGDKEGRFESKIYKDILNKDDKLGILSHLYSYKNNTYLSNALKFSETPNSWYSLSLSSEIIYKLENNKLVKEEIDLCKKIRCLTMFELEDSKIIITKESIIKYKDNNIIWNYKINRYGAGVAFINEEKEMLYGDHTELLRLDLRTGNKIKIETNINFANIVDIDKINDREFVITDSDSGTIYFTKLFEDKLEMLSSISGNNGSTEADIIKIKESNGNLFVLTSNPSYLYKMNLKNYKVDFLIGNGTNSYAIDTINPLNSGMYYPNDFFIDENGIIYIPEANNRILSLNKNKLSIYAGSIENGNAIGKNNCSDPLFSNVRSISKIKNSLIVSDSGNNRILSLEKTDSTCNLNKIVLENSLEDIKFSFITYLFRNKDSNYLIEQNANRILVFNDNLKLIDSIGSRLYTADQGMGKDDNFSVKKELANFSTPVDVCFNNSNSTLYIADLFNGKIKSLDKKGNVETVKLNTKDYILPISCSVYNNNLYYVNGLTNKIYKNELIKED